MFSGIIITTDGSAQVFGDVDFEKLIDVIDQLLPQFRQGASQQRKERLKKLLDEVDRAELEAALSTKAE